MTIMYAILPFVTSLVVLTAASRDASAADSVRHNANHIFNSVHHAMRQWGSSLDHNGMSMFLVTVPASTEFYHGTSSRQRINETEWLAFEPEHALMFAHCDRPGRGGKGPPPPPFDPSKATDLDENESLHPKEAVDYIGKSQLGHSQTLLNKFRRYMKQSYTVDNQEDDGTNTHASTNPGIPDTDEPCEGYLHTYCTKRQLQLLYVDGQSAAKSNKGTLDVQDLILRAPTIRTYHMVDKPHRRPGGPPNEQLRALELCHLAKHEWDDQIDGVLRMEAGFEIILCSFEDNLDLVSIQQQQARSGDGPGSRDKGDQLSYFQAVAARYDGIGGHRVHLDYSSFLSVYAYDNATIFDDRGLPRVVNESSIIQRIREDLREMLALPFSVGVDSTDWQAITDMIVARYANRIQALVSEKTSSLAGLRAGLDRALRPFIDYGNRSVTHEIHRCSEQFLSLKATKSNSMAAIAVKETYKTLCKSLLNASAADNLEEGLRILRSLQQWLGWTTWKKCVGCEADEVCVIPIWPWGSKQDFEHPRCSNMTDSGRGDYWDKY